MARSPGETARAHTPVETAAGLRPDVRQALRDLLLVLADSKRLLGFRYAGWILGAPELESGIACAAMAQDEWGHARLTYALLQDFGDDVAALEHARAPHEYACMEVLDREPEDWAGLIALNAFADTALSVQFEALSDCCYLPLRQRTGKLLAEEHYHAAHAGAWARRFLRGQADARARFVERAHAMLPAVLAWFGARSGRGALLAQAGICNGTSDDLRARFRTRVEPLVLLMAPDGVPDDPATADFDEIRRRTRRAPGGGLGHAAPQGDALLVLGAASDDGLAGPDLETIVRVRGDRNRPFLLD